MPNSHSSAGRRSSQQGLSQQQARDIAEACYAEVLAYCKRHAPAGHEAADLAQETFLRFVRAGSYNERGKPIAYLMRVARSVCVDAARARRVQTVALDFDVAEEGSDFAASGNALEGALERALGTLPAEMREALELRFGTGLQVNEVATALGVSRFAARRRINIALKLLEAELTKDESDE